MFCSDRRRARFRRRLCRAAALIMLDRARRARRGLGWLDILRRRDGGGDEIWLTEVFAASMDRERLEGEFKAYLKSRGESGAVVQCPAAKDEKIEMLNARFTASEFHRKLGDVMHEVKLSEFAPRR